MCRGQLAFGRSVTGHFIISGILNEAIRCLNTIHMQAQSPISNSAMRTSSATILLRKNGRGQVISPHSRGRFVPAMSISPENRKVKYGPNPKSRVSHQ